MFVARRRFSSELPKFKRVAVIGLGLMGHGIAQLSAQAGYEVMALENSAESLSVGMKRIEQSLDRQASKQIKSGTHSEAQARQAVKDALARINATTRFDDLSSLGESALVVEALPEQLALKLDFHARLSLLLPKDTVIASNTSSLAVTQMAKASNREDKFVGLHFFNPVQVMKLVEVIRTEQTSPVVFDSVTKFAKSLGKTTVSCKDTPGFIVNRLLVPYFAQAFAMVDRGDASVRDIDISMQLGAGHPMGPLQLADYVGLDTTHSILSGWMQAHPEEPAFFVPECLDRLVGEGKLGRKSGQGFYKWDGDKPVIASE